ncbi:TolC family outer membrane protein [Carnimonas bestiolae]|uniref:TolC family outer membrane protein n=1 Tax=Carnimonas bestiolae TaxID=3402172 RepID=UPI003EDC5FB5
MAPTMNMMRGLAAALVSTSVLLSASAHAQSDTRSVEPAPLDFATAYKMALQQDPTWRAAQHQRDADAQERALGRSRLLPNLSYSYSRARNWQHSRIENFNGTNREKRNYNSYSSSFSLSQPLFDAASFAQYREGSERAEAAEYTLERARQALAVQVLQAYTDLLYAQDQLALTTAQKRSLVEDEARAHAFIAGGEGTKTDQFEIQARLKVVDAQVIQAEDQVADARNTLGKMIGAVMITEPLVQLKTDSVLSLDTAKSIDEWREQALRHNPELVAGRHMVEASRQRINAEMAGHLPVVQAFARHQISDSDSANQVGQHYKTNSLGVQINVPIFEGGRVLASTDQASAQYEQSLAQLDGDTRDMLNDVDHQYRTLVSSQRRGDAYAEAVDAAQQRLHATRMSIRGGERTNLDALDAEQQYYESLSELRRSRYDQLLAWLSLRWEAGSLEEQDILRVAQFFTDLPVRGLSLKEVD